MTDQEPDHRKEEKRGGRGNAKKKGGCRGTCLYSKRSPTRKKGVANRGGGKRNSREGPSSIAGGGC